MVFLVSFTAAALIIFSQGEKAFVKHNLWKWIQTRTNPRLSCLNDFLIFHADVNGDDILSGADGYPVNCTAGYSLWCMRGSQNAYTVLYQCRMCEDGFVQSQEISMNIQSTSCNNTYFMPYYPCIKCEDGTFSNDDRTQCQGKWLHFRYFRK